MPPNRTGYSLATKRTITAAMATVRRKYGAATARNVVDFARPKNSPLHRFFEWDDSKAAELHRLSQARDLISRVVVNVEVQGKPRPIRVFVGVDRDGERQYVPTVEALSKSDLAAEILAEMKAEMQAMIRRYEAYEFIKGSVSILRRALAELDGKRG